MKKPKPFGTDPLIAAYEAQALVDFIRARQALGKPVSLLQALEMLRKVFNA